MRIVAFLTDPPLVQAILLHLGLPHRPPQVTPARALPQAKLAFDQTPDFDPTDAQPPIVLARSFMPAPELAHPPSLPQRHGPAPRLPSQDRSATRRYGRPGLTKQYWS
jgi:hypothetical protein